MVTLIARYRARPGAGDEVTRILSRHIAASRAKPGCKQFDACRSTDDGALSGQSEFEAVVGRGFRNANRDDERLSREIDGATVSAWSHRHRDEPRDSDERGEHEGPIATRYPPALG